MKLNQATDYAFRMILHMSLLPFGTKITGGDLAKAQKIPERFLLKIMRSLTAAKIMQSYRGVDGGFALLKKPKDITLYTVIEAVEGEAYLQRCLYDADSCTRNCEGYCGIRSALGDVQKNLLENLKKVTFEEIAKRECEMKKLHGRM